MKNFWLGLFEVCITVGIGVYLYVYPQKQQLAEIVFAVGFLFLLHRILLMFSIEDKFDSFSNQLAPLDKIKEIIDLDSKSDIETLDAIRRVYLSIREQEFREIKDNFIKEALKNLTQLSHQKKTDELSSSAYYDWIFDTFDSTKSGDKIQAVSIMDTLEWDDSPEEKNFFKSNISAAKRNVNVDRVFVMKKSMLEEALKVDAIKAHKFGNRNKLIGRFVDKDHLQNVDQILLNDVGNGFIIVNKRVVLIDEFDSDGKARGVVSMNRDDVNNYERIFKNLSRKSVLLGK